MMNRLSVIFVVLLTLGLAGAVFACPSCKSTLSGDEQIIRAQAEMEQAVMKAGLESRAAQKAEAQLEKARVNARTTRSYFYSIIFMMAAPYVILGGFVFVFRRALQKAKADKASALSALQN